MALRDSQLRRNLSKATSTIRAKREGVVDEVPDWQELRRAGSAIKDASLIALDQQLSALESAVVAAGGVVHWANDGNEGCSIVAGICRPHGVDEVVKVKSIATDEIKLNEALADAGVSAVETDLAELIIQLGDDVQSHILVPAIHKNRAEIRELFARELDLPDLTDEPAALAEAARLHLRRKFLDARMGVSGANFAVAETGTVSRVRVGGQRPHVHDAPRGARDRDGDREGRAVVARHGGVPAAVAALVDGRADEPVHVVLDRRAAG